MIAQMGEITFMHCRRDGNQAAHVAAKMTVQAGVDGVWLEEASLELERVFSRDYRVQSCDEFNYVLFLLFSCFFVISISVKKII